MTEIINDDILAWAERYQGPKFHSLFCDAPYHLDSITKRFGKTNSAPAKGGVYQRSSRGFMGQEWDGGDIAFRPETWIALKDHLYPGAFCISFAATRNYHRMAVAIEDAGFIIHPMIGWIQSQGFPKATRIDTQIDKNVEREIVGYVERWGNSAGKGRGGQYANDYEASTIGAKRIDPVTKPTEAAQTWEGHRYGLQALSPSFEPICVFQKPYEGRPIDNITDNGAGALNIDAARIEGNKPYHVNTWDDNNAHPFGNGAGNDYTQREITDRWPKNVIIDDDVDTGKDDFFYRIQYDLEQAEPFFYCPKVSPGERNYGLDDMDREYIVKIGAEGLKTNPTTGKPENRLPRKNNHPTLKPLRLTSYLAKLLLPPEKYAPRRILIPFAGTMSEAIGAQLAGWDEIVAIELMKEYCEIGKRRIEFWENRDINKPIRIDKQSKEQMRLF